MKSCRTSECLIRSRWMFSLGLPQLFFRRQNIGQMIQAPVKLWHRLSLLTGKSSKLQNLQV